MIPEDLHRNRVEEGGDMGRLYSGSILELLRVIRGLQERIERLERGSLNP